MNEPTRRGIAYIAGRALSRKSCSAIYDYNATQYFNFGGTVVETRVSVFDYDEGCYITGSGGGRSYSLFHHGNQSHVKLDVGLGTFNGFDYDSNSHFTGKVNGNVVWVFDYEESEWFSFSI
jgi:hypothetical protein